ncbi:hypothetical protein [Melittangium boletus]|uniref:Lipoprotein n=1 Tax=Melittangium boletus DSM 14713 TaxID=1294270 RepID=A0A250IEQ7_9BACT|nr:hypothetical protein [Melittangium boletus]ATB30324.1 hypothetical protein MEBOL_003784 [Melittangium boletus DSM 14713]
MPLHVRIFLSALLLFLSACKKSPPRDPSTLPPVDCTDNLDCFMARARVCAPASILHREQVEVSGASVHTVTRHEVVGRVQGRCHLRLTRVEPPPPPIREVKDPFLPDAEPVEEPSAEQMALDERSPPRRQCLYHEDQLTEAVRRLSDGLPTPEDLEPCYPGDGRCGPVPLLSPPCALGDCLLGRWTYSCEARGGREIYACEGTRLSDASPPDAGCASWCGADGREQLDCRKRLETTE